MHVAGSSIRATLTATLSLNDADAGDGYTSQNCRLANGLDYLRQLDRGGHLTRIGNPCVKEERQQHDTLGRLTQRIPPILRPSAAPAMYGTASNA